MRKCMCMYAYMPFCLYADMPIGTDICIYVHACICPQPSWLKLPFVQQSKALPGVSIPQASLAQGRAAAEVFAE